MIGRYFEPDDKICLIFSNEYYDKLRENPVFSHREHYDRRGRDDPDDEFMYPDLPCAREWADEFEEGIKAYGISADQIQRYKDTDFNTMR